MQTRMRRGTGTWTWIVAAVAVALTVGAAAADGMTPWDVARLESVGDIAVSPDGGHVAFVLSVPRTPWADEDGRAWGELWVWDVADAEARPFVTGEVNVSGLDWRPGHGEISFTAKRGDDEHTGVWTIPADGGEARRLVVPDDRDVSSYTWSPDGDRIATISTEPMSDEAEEAEEKGFDAVVYEEDWTPVRVRVHDVGGDGDGIRDEAAEPMTLELDGNPFQIAWSPAGDRLAVTLAPTPLVDDEYMKQRVSVVEAGTGRVVTKIANPGKIEALRWSPGGDRLAMLSGRDINDPSAGTVLIADAANGVLRRPAAGLFDDTGHASAIAWAGPDELMMLFDHGVETDLRRLRLDGTTATVVAGEGAPAFTRMSASAGCGTVALVGSTPRHPSELYLLTADGPTRLTDHNPWLADVELAPQEILEWTAPDGLELQGMLIHPLDAEAGQSYPLIAVVHGGPEAHYRYGWLTSYSSPGQVAAARGFAVFYPNYRGSTGRGVVFSKTSQGDPGGAEFDDVIEGVDAAAAAGLEPGSIDLDRVGVTGGSYGGYATAWLSTRHTERFAAGVMFVGISDKVSKWGTSDIPEELVLVHDLHYPWEAWDLFRERSPITYVEQARTPLLILHGEEDPRVHPGQSLELYRYLKVLDETPVRLILYPGEGHGNRRAASRFDYNLRMLRWFEHYLQGEGGEPPAPRVEYAEHLPADVVGEDEDAPAAAVAGGDADG